MLGRKLTRFGTGRVYARRAVWELNYNIWIFSGARLKHAPCSFFSRGGLYTNKNAHSPKYPHLLTNLVHTFCSPFFPPLISLHFIYVQLYTTKKPRHTAECFLQQMCIQKSWRDFCSQVKKKRLNFWEW